MTDRGTGPHYVESNVASEVNSRGLEKRKYTYSTDENGFFEPSRLYDNPDLTMVFLGGSTIEGYLKDAPSRWPNLVRNQLEKILNIKINAYNSGKSAINLPIL